MMYPFLTLDDDAVIVHSEMKSDGSVEVYIEKPDAECCFRSASCILPDYRWINIDGLSDDEITKYQSVIESTAHLII